MKNLRENLQHTHTQWGRGKGWGRWRCAVPVRCVSVLRHLAVGISLPDELYIPAVAFLDDVVQPP